ncbi:hypothetical protein CSC66_11170 [Pseudoxanthomonas kaohsiungensis]|nr:hypothetical protein CSC66_11170 [Pseudoxanthomonas kaohsiungensis]
MELGRLMNIDAILYETLLELAKAKKLASYSEVAPLIGLDMAQPQDRDEIARKLGDIVFFEHDNDRPMLTALVVHQGGDNNPGEGFFSAAEKIGLFKATRDPIKRLIFWQSQVALVHSHWASASHSFKSNPLRGSA